MLLDCAFLPSSRFVLTVNTGTPPPCIMLGNDAASSPSQLRYTGSRNLDQKWYVDRSPKSMPPPSAVKRGSTEQGTLGSEWMAFHMHICCRLCVGRANASLTSLPT